MAAGVTTAGVFLAVALLFVPFGLVLYFRRGDVSAYLASLPAEVAVGVGGFGYVLDLDAVAASDWGALRTAGFDLLGPATVLGIMLPLFGLVVFALLIRKEGTVRTLRAAVSPQYREVLDALFGRLRNTLLALYVLQAATALATFLVGAAVFAAFGYLAFVLLALLAGILQFLPIIGPRLVVAALVAVELIAGDVARALTVGLVAWAFVGWLPDLVIRPRLAERSAHHPGSLYFVGFTGGLLTLGPIGIIAGPVVVALLFEALTLLGVQHAALEESLFEGPSD
ncbi:MAG: AI-2E family transporter [Halobacteriales archaeon]